jgi:hypothetical protein
VVLNAAAGIVAFGGPEPAELLAQLGAAMARCEAALDQGAGERTLQVWIAASQQARVQA